MAQGHNRRRPRTRRERRVLKERLATGGQTAATAPSPAQEAPATPSAEPRAAPTATTPSSPQPVTTGAARPRGFRAARTEQQVTMPPVRSELVRVAFVTGVVAAVLVVLYFILR